MRKIGEPGVGETRRSPLAGDYWCAFQFGLRVVRDAALVVSVLRRGLQHPSTCAGCVQVLFVNSGCSFISFEVLSTVIYGVLGIEIRCTAEEVS